jgi:hypothetical protein
METEMSTPINEEQLQAIREFDYWQEQPRGAYQPDDGDVANTAIEHVNLLLEAISQRDATIADQDRQLSARYAEIVQVRQELRDSVGQRDATIAELREKQKSWDAEAWDMLLSRAVLAERELAEMLEKLSTQDFNIAGYINREQSYALQIRDLRSDCEDHRRRSDSLCRDLAQSQSELAELRKPVAVERNQQVEHWRMCLRTCPWTLEPKHFAGLLSAYDALARENSAYAKAHIVLTTERDAAREEAERIRRIYGHATEYWQARFNVLTDAWNSGNNDAVLDACRKFVTANDDAPARAKLEEMRELREIVEHAAVVKDVLHTAFSGIKGGFTLPDWWVPNARAAIVKWDAMVRPLSQDPPHVSDPPCRSENRGQKCTLERHHDGDHEYAPAADTADLLEYGYAPGNYTGHCLTCDQTMEWVDKRCRCCMPCAIRKRDAALAQPTESRNV